MILRSILYILCCYQFWSPTIQSASTDPLVCVPGLMTWGVTSPKGDIMIEVGETLEVNCTIDMAHWKVNGRTSKDIQFRVAKHEIPDDRLETTIINESTSMLRIKDMNVSTPLVNCYLTNPETSVCENQIDVGYPPLPVENLKCVARNWASLNCTWDKPRNNIFTTYNISYGFREYFMKCPNKVDLSKTTESCEWNGRTEPHYRQNSRLITIVMTGINYLKPEGVRWRYEFHNWEIVIPSVPQRLQVEPISPYEISVKWSFHNFELFTPGLNHKITVCPRQPIHDCLVKELKTNHIAHTTQRIILPYAYTEYQVEVTMKSQVANNTPEFWSPPAINPLVRTLPKRPEFAPITGLGTFEVFNKYQLRDVTLYWKRIPHHLQNGSSFHYKFTVFEDNIQRTDIVPQLKNGVDFAFFGNLTVKSYRFEIQSVNSEGESQEKAIVFVPRSTEEPAEPQSVSKLDYTNGTFEISWQHGGNERNIVLNSYTVYRCLGSKTQCDELVEWIDVEPEQTHYIFQNLESSGINHVFAVSANTKVASSGMVVATCELVHNKIPGKLKQVRGSQVMENSLEIKWDMDCSFKPGLVISFRITYCKILTNPTCADNSSSQDLIVAGNSTTSILDNLEPYTSYVIWVSMVTQAGESQTSDPIMLKTKEAAPTDPPWVTTIKMTNTSALLHIQAPIKINGVIEKYEIEYNPVSSGVNPDAVQGKTIEANELDLDENGSCFHNLTDLESNTNYTIRVRACTIRCSNFSEPLYLLTEFGYTKLTAMPSLTYEDGRILVSWNSPSHLGGPIKYYEILVRKNGELAEPVTIEYDPDRKTYLEAMDLKCQASTNITARVRAISVVGAEQLFGNWSPEGSFNCYANDVWFIWILIVIASLICLGMLTFVSVKCWQKIKAMITPLDVIAPPGMEQLQLSGFSERQGPRIRQNLESDTQPFRKESLICQTIGYHPEDLDDTKDYMCSESKENEKGGQRQPLDMDILHGMNPSVGEGIVVRNETLASDNCPIWQLWNSPLALSSSNQPNEERNSSLSNFPLNNMNTLRLPSLLGQPPNSDVLLDKGTSPSPSIPLISDSSATNSEEDGDDMEHYRTLNFEPYGSLSFSNAEPLYDNSNPVPMTNGHTWNNDSGQDANESYDYTKLGSLPGLCNGVIPNGQMPEQNKTSAYVKWTSLKLDPIIGPGIVNGKAPYCQVGILLEQ